MELLQPSFEKNDKSARWLIFTLSFVVFAAIVLLSRMKLDVNLGFDAHLFAKINAVINSIVSFLLIMALLAVRARKYLLHKRIMITAITLSCLFLVSYICHHLFAGETKYGGHGSLRYIYFVILATHIILAAVILPFVLFTAYRGLTGEYEKHRKLSRITWPIWLYVSITGVLVYLLISPYYTHS
jgi:putative membrane protein